MSRPSEGYFVNGVRRVSVTEALNLTRVRRWQGDRSSWQRRAEIGTAVHKAAAILDCNKQSWNTAPPHWLELYDCVSPEVMPMCLAWERFKRECYFEPRLIEHSFFDADLEKHRLGIGRFATTIDREGLLRGKPAIIEIKTPKVIEPYWGVQIAGQELAILCSQGPPRERPYHYARYVVQLRADGSYKLIPYESPNDRHVFLWSLGIALWNQANYPNGGKE